MHELSLLQDIFCGNEHISKLSSELLQVVPASPFEESEETGRLWMGNAGHVSHLHFDAHHGLLITLHGLKHATLYVPVDNIGIIEKSSHGNHSAHNPLKTALPSAISMQCEIEVGDALFIPVYWWHLISSVTDSVAINFWAYPDLNASRLKFGALWPFTSLLCRDFMVSWLSINQGAKKFALLSEKNATMVVEAILRGKRGKGPDWEEFMSNAIEKVRRVITAL